MHFAVSGYVTLAILLLLVGGGVVFIVQRALARLLLAPPRLTDARALFLFHRMSPGDLDLKFEEPRLIVSASDEELHRSHLRADRRIPLSAWWIAAARPSDVCVILLHGYSDAKIGAIAWAPMLHALGMHVLAIDLRAHGESGGRYFTAGYFERHDIAQVIQQLQLERPRQCRRFVLFGINVGATVAAAVAAGVNESGDAVAAVICDGAFADFSRAIGGYLRVIGSPGAWLHRWIVRAAERVSHADFSQVDLRRTLPGLKCPVMLIQNAGDRFLDEPAAAEMRDIVAQRPADRLTVFWESEEPSPFDASTDIAEYQRRIAAFLDEALAAEPLPTPDAR